MVTLLHVLRCHTCFNHHYHLQTSDKIVPIISQEFLLQLKQLHEQDTDSSIQLLAQAQHIELPTALKELVTQEDDSNKIRVIADFFNTQQLQNELKGTRQHQGLYAKIPSHTLHALATKMLPLPPSTYENLVNQSTDWDFMQTRNGSEQQSILTADLSTPAAILASLSRWQDQHSLYCGTIGHI